MMRALGLQGQRPGPPALPFRPNRRRVGAAGSVAAARSDGPTAVPRPARDRGRPLLRPPHRLSVALPARDVRPLVQGLRPLLALARGWHLGEGAGHAAPGRAGATGPAP